MSTIPTEQEASDYERLPDAEDAETTAPDTLHDSCVLLAEDNVINQQVAVRMLNKFGFAVDVVSNGQQAVAALQKQPYGMVLMDCMMPVMDGFEATRQIRRREFLLHRHTPIIAMTAIDQPGDRQRCLDAGMDDFLPKPINPADLRAVLDFWFGNSEAMQTSAELSAENMDDADMVADEAPIELSRLRVFLGDDEEAISELLSVFSDSLRNLRERLKLGVKERSSSVKDLAHELKGAAGNMGAGRLHVLALQLEQVAQSHDWPTAERLHGVIDDEIQSVTEYVSSRN